jgi:RimJ/RimL family protein N-acetyltransferase
MAVIGCRGVFIMTERELLRLHIEAVWNLTLPAIDEAADELALTQPFPPWSLYLGMFAQEEVTIWHPEIPPEQRLLYLANARKADVVWDQALEMRREVVFHYPLIRQEQQARARQAARLLHAEDVALLDAFEPEGAPHVFDPHKAPYVGVVVDGRLMSIAHSSRQTPAACELGIDTLPEARRRGYAAAATTLWTAIVQQKGLVPIYSAFAWNTASLQLARAAGYIPRINGVYGPVPEASE